MHQTTVGMFRAVLLEEFPTPLMEIADGIDVYGGDSWKGLGRSDSRIVSNGLGADTAYYIWC
jgi:hypothetical protein